MAYYIKKFYKDGVEYVIPKGDPGDPGQSIRGPRGNGITSIETVERTADGATNDITIKTDDDQEGVTFHVKNGHSIDHITEQASNVPGGDNTITVTLTDGTSQTFSVKNGHSIANVTELRSDVSNGDNVVTLTLTDGTTFRFTVKNGAKGDSIIKGEGDLVLTHVLGDDDTIAMSQKGVTDEVTVTITITGEEIAAADEKNYIYGDKWNSISLGNSGRIIDISSYKRKRILVASNENYGAKIAFLKSNSNVSGDDVVYCDGTSYINNLVAGEVYDGVVPSDCNYLYIRYDGSGNVVAPISVIIHETVKDKISTLETEMESKVDTVSSSVNFDLSIDDENGKHIAIFKEGHIQTKNFDSKKISIVTIDDVPVVDFSIDDESGNKISIFTKGHMMTKNFDSSKVRQFSKGSSRISFSYPVDCRKPFSDTWSTADTINTYTEPLFYDDNAVLYLPEQYTANGTPTRLIIYCKHGASTVEPGADSLLNDGGDGRIMRYLLSIGYAILAADGVPNDYATLIGITERVVGNYIAVQSTRAAYDYVVANYNIADDGCFVYGWSQGGHYAQNVTDLCGFNVLATAELSPVCSYRYHQWDLIASVNVGGVTWEKSARLNIARLFGFPTVTTNAELNALEYDAQKVQGYDPWTRNVENPYTGFVQGSTYGNNLWVLPSGTSLSDITMKKYLNAPLKIWCAVNDPTVSPDVMKVFIQAAKNAGCIADMHIFSTGSHNVNSQQTTKIGTYTYYGGTYDLYPIAVEVARWFRDFGGNEFSLD